MLTEKEIEAFFKNIDVITIIPDRYLGTYSGGRFLAFFMDHWEIPDEVDGGDFECRDFWRHFDGIVGRGNTPNEAAIDLAQQLKDRGSDHWFSFDIFRARC